MKEYETHKRVKAGEIIGIFPEDDVIMLKNDEWIEPSDNWWVRYQASNEPYLGGYYVVYADGYDSWSPANVFEESATEV